ncbi:hypothetical protein V2A60_001160 [Cordyceps javanica]
MGVRSVSKESIRNILSKGGPKNDGQGRAVTIVIGGARESLEAQPGTLRLILRGRKGFVKMALRSGADLVPVIGFGENDIYDQLSPKTHPLVHKLQMFTLKVFKFTLPALHGRGLLNYDVGLMPYRRPVNVVIGKPIAVHSAPGHQPTSDEIDYYHELYIRELESLWETYKDHFVPSRVSELEINMTRSSPRKRSGLSYKEEDDRAVKKSSAASKALGSRRSAATERAVEPQPKRKISDDSAPKTKPAAEAPQPKKRKTAKGKDEDTMPLGNRTAVSSLKKAMYIGAHVSAAGGVNNSVTNAVHIGANSFALFLKSQRKWDNPPITSEAKDLFISGCSHHGYKAAEHALPHGSYLVNLAQSDPAKATQAYNAFLDDLIRCEQLGIKLYNFHPGSTLGDSRDAAIGRIAAQLNKSHKATSSVITVLENMAGSGNIIGSTWEDLRDIIALVDDKSRVGVCIDTCHAFAAGHDLRTPETFSKTFDAFNKIVGINYLKAFHLNDSKAPFASNRDLHANIGTGFLGLRAFHSLMNEDGFCGMPMVLETPIDRKDANGKTIENKQVWADEIKLLESLIGMNAESEEFVALEKELKERGATERRRIQDQVDKKGAKSGGKKTAAGKKKKSANTDDESN